MGDLLAKVLPLALGAAISPTVLAVALVVLSGRRPIARGTAYLAGVLTVFAGITALGLIASHRTQQSPAETEITQVVDAIAGGLLLLLALGTVLRPLVSNAAAPSPDAPVDGSSVPDERRGLLPTYLLGVVMMVVNFSTILLYLPAMREISAASVPDADKAVVVTVVLVIASSPAWLPYLFRIVLPGPSTRAFGALHAFIARHTRQIGVAIEVIFGVYLLIKAFR